MSIESIRRELWIGEIPVCFVLCPDDLASIADEPEPCCMMIPRNSYLPLHTPEVISYFAQYVKKNLKDSEVWYDCGEHKIKWQLPVGVTYDVLYGIKDLGHVWNIKVHFSNFPDQELLRCPSVAAVKSNFISSIKEADSLKHGSRIMNDMKQPENAMLWNGLLTRNFDEFWSVNRKLMDCPQTNQSDNYRHLPIRVYMPNKKYSQPYIASYDESLQKEPSLSDLLHLLAIELYDGMYVISQGIPIPVESSLYKLVQTLSYPDNFLYLCVVDSN